jgi:hypothetical protein
MRYRCGRALPSHAMSNSIGSIKSNPAYPSGTTAQADNDVAALKPEPSIAPPPASQKAPATPIETALRQLVALRRLSDLRRPSATQARHASAAHDALQDFTEARKDTDAAIARLQLLERHS